MSREQAPASDARSASGRDAERSRTSSTRLVSSRDLGYGQDREAGQEARTGRRRSTGERQGSRRQGRPAEAGTAEGRPAARFTAIDGLRVFAMLAIVVYHARTSLLPGGFVGVTVFFTISGYLITDSLLREHARTGKIDVVKFYRKRLLRLMPLMLAVVATTAILCAIFAPQLLEKMRGDAAPALLFFENWWYIFREQSYFAASGLPSPLTHFWFLSVLGQFYLVWPWFVAIVSRIVPSRSWQRRLVGLLAIGSAVLAAMLFDPMGDPSRVYYGTDTRLAEILVGAWLAYAWPTDGDSGLCRFVDNSLPFPQVLDLFGLVALVALGRLCFVVNGYSPILYRGGLFLVAVLTAVVLASVVRPRSLLAVPLGVQPFPAISARSFGVYLWHYPLLLIMNPATRTTALPWWGWVLEGLAIVGATELTYQLVEKPLANSGKAAKGDHARARRRGMAPATVVLLLLMCAAATGLIVVGPFWYEDGALQQAQAPQGQGTATQPQPTTAHEGVPEVLDASSFTDIGEGIETEGHTIASVVVDTARELEVRLRGFSIDPETGKTNAPVILIGDSVPAGAIDQFYEIFPYGYIDAEVGRQLYVADDVYLDDVAAGYGKDVVVFSSGDNGVADDDDMEHLLSAAAGHQIYLVTVRVPLPLQDMNNALFREYADRYDNVEIIDWYAESEGHDEYFWDDGTHLRPEGAEAYVLMLRRAIVGE